MSSNETDPHGSGQGASGGYGDDDPHASGPGAVHGHGPASGSYAAHYGQPNASGYSGYPGGYAPGYPVPPTNTLAIIALVASLAGLLTWISSIAGIVCGHIARRQIQRTGEQGSGMALAGLIVGYSIAVLGILWFVLLFVILMVGAGAGIMNEL